MTARLDLNVYPATIQLKATNELASQLFPMAAMGMLDYYEERSEQSEKAEEFLAKQKRLQGTIERLQDID